MLNENDKNTSGYAWCLATGIATISNAAFNCFIICNHPEYQAANAANTTPAGADPSKMTEENVKRYLAAHPEVAAAALGGAKPNAGGGGGGGGGGGDGDWVKEAEARQAAGGGAKKAAPAGGFFGFGGAGAKKAPEAAYEPPVLPYSAAAPAPAAAAPPLPGRAAVDNVEDNPFASQ